MNLRLLLSVLLFLKFDFLVFCLFLLYFIMILGRDVRSIGFYRTLSKPRCPTNPVIGHCQIYGVRQILLSDTVKTAVSDKYCYRTLSKLRCPTNTVIGHCQIYGVRQILLSDTVKTAVSDKSRYRTLSNPRCLTNPVIGHC